MAWFSKHYSEPEAEAALKALLIATQFARFKVGKYTGDAAATKAITGVGFKPTFLIIYGMTTDRSLALKSSQDTTQAFVVPSGADVLNAYLDDQIISLDADGFTVGDGTGSTNYLNIAENYVYVAFG